MAIEFQSFLAVLATLIIINYLFVWKTNKMLSGLILIATGMFCAFSSIAGTNIDQYFIYASALLILLGSWIGIAGFTQRGIGSGEAFG